MASPRCRVVLVEDQEAVRRSLERALRFHGSEVVSATNVLAAQQLLLAGACDLLLSDISLAQQDDGIQLTQWARAAMPDLPIVLISGLPNPQLPAALRDDARLHLLAKPFGMAQLGAIMTSLLPLAA